MDENLLSTHGYTIIDFNNLTTLYQIQEITKQTVPFPPTEFHKKITNDEERLLLIKKIKDLILDRNLISRLFLDNIDFLIPLLGPDIDIQTDFYLRISRPNLENDFIDWHRDTFYGNSYWELNFWFPIFELEKGAGLMVVDASHLESANNVHSTDDKNTFRNKVTKGSLANELGYLYAPKVDDTISNLDTSRIKLLTPQFGQGIIFFTHMAHRAHNSSSKTRISADLRIKNMFAPTYTRPGYFKPLVRSVITSCVEKILALNEKQNNQ